MSDFVCCSMALVCRVKNLSSLVALDTTILMYLHSSNTSPCRHTHNTIWFCMLQYGAFGQGEESQWIGRMVCRQRATAQTGQPCHCWYAFSLFLLFWKSTEHTRWFHYQTASSQVVQLLLNWCFAKWQSDLVRDGCTNWSISSLLLRSSCLFSSYVEIHKADVEPTAADCLLASKRSSAFWVLVTPACNAL